MLSTSLSRGTLIFGKYLGGIISLLIPFTMGTLAGLLVVALDPGVQFQRMNPLAFLLLLFASYVYVSIFLSVSLMFSARSHTSNEAVLKSLFVWVLLVLVIPNISPSFATIVYSIPSATKMEQDVSRITSADRDRIINQRGHEMLQTTFSDLSAIHSMSDQQIQDRVNSDPAFRERYAQYSKAWDEMVKDVNRIQQGQAQKILVDFARRSKYQELLATEFAMISPFSDFILAATDLTDTGLEADSRWESQGSAYERELRSFVEARYRSEKEKNPALTSNDYLDLRDRPRFQYQGPGSSELADMVMIPLGLLLVFNVIFLGMAIMSFLKYDVR
jgi:ABC-type transport system involved in multi-copper enzyme maturation permease subunit